MTVFTARTCRSAHYAPGIKETRLTLHGHDPPLCRFELELRVDRNCEARRIARRQLLSPALAGGGDTRASKAETAAAAAAKLTLSRVLVNVSRDGFAGDDVLGHAILIHAHRRQNRQGARIDLGAPVRDDADDDCFAIFFVSFEKNMWGRGAGRRRGRTLALANSPFFQPSAPQILLRFRSHKCWMFSVRRGLGQQNSKKE